MTRSVDGKNKKSCLCYNTQLVSLAILVALTVGSWIQSNRLTRSLSGHSSSVLSFSYWQERQQALQQLWARNIHFLDAKNKKHPYRPTIPLHELVDTLVETECPPGLVLLQDIRTPNVTRRRRTTTTTTTTSASSSSSSWLLPPRKIPRIIHVTSKSRCVTPRFAEVLASWKNYSDHEFYFHNDAALHRLLFEKEWPEFPQLHLALECSNSMVEQADLWRALVIWEYGGIYTDTDNMPKEFNPSTTLTADDEAYFEVERGGWLSQYFFAAQPRHPLMYLLVMQIWQRIFTLENVGDQYAPYLTGPGALKVAMKHFMQTHRMPAENRNPCDVFEKVCPGHYVGLANRSVTVTNQTVAVYRSVVGKKTGEYKAMNMTHFGTVQSAQTNESCINRLFLARRAIWEQSYYSYWLEGRSVKGAPK
ncbi:hypothetical protein ACA910_013386 [Epithemia clementina (nom. ined.)]